MDRISQATSLFIQFLRGRDQLVPHKQLKTFLKKLQEIAVIEDELGSEPSSLQELLKELVKQERRLSGRDGMSMLIVLLKVVQQMFDTLHKQLCHVKKPNRESEQLIEKVVELERLVQMASVESEPTNVQGSIAVDVETTLESLLHHPLYVHHYRATHPDFLSAVTVLLWNGDVPGPPFIHEGEPVVYVSLPRDTTTEDLSSWGASSLFTPSPPATETDIAAAKAIASVIRDNQAALFAKHSNLVAIRCGKQGPDAALGIEFVVAGKGFKPVADLVQLPSMIEGVRTMTTHGWVELCGKKERAHHRPLLPGTGFAAAAAAGAKIEITQREEDCKPPVMGTFGGAFVAGDAVYAVTCAHNLQSGDTAGVFHPPGSSVYQPCAMGLIINAAGTHMESYDQLKRLEGHHYAMRTLMDTVMGESENSFNNMISSDYECGKVMGTIMGPIFGTDVNVDVGIVQLLPGVELLERCCKSDLLKRGTLESPRLRLGDNATTFLAPDDFPPSPFHVYGRGERSNDSMIATVDPTRDYVAVRPVAPQRASTPSYECIHAIVSHNFQQGDSGMWCWTSPEYGSHLVGMAMARVLDTSGRSNCCILRMSVVDAAVRQVVNKAVLV
eukprot:gene31170-37671_t